MSAPPRGPELKAIYAASVADIAPVEWGGEKVITSEVLAKAYGTEAVNIRKNHSNNSDRFEEGKHFHKITGADLVNLRVNLGNSQISPQARSMILWTERGAARHAKMLETDAAWDVFEALEDSYFRHHVQRDVVPAGAELSTVDDREHLYHGAVRMMLKHRLPFNKVYQTMNYYAHSKHLAEMSKDQVGEAERFVERYLVGQDTRADWLRIGANRRDLTGDDAQPDLLGLEAPGTLSKR